MQVCISAAYVVLEFANGGFNVTSLLKSAGAFFGEVGGDVGGDGLLRWRYWGLREDMLREGCGVELELGGGSSGSSGGVGGVGEGRVFAGVSVGGGDRMEVVVVGVGVVVIGGFSVGVVVGGGAGEDMIVT